MKAIVTGATGFLGTHLVELLSAKGWQIIAIGRNDAKGNNLNSENVDYRHADITSKEQLETAFENADVVFHCAALSSTWGKYQRFFEVNVIGTRNVLNCAIQSRVGRIVYVSSTSVYFNYKDRFDISEDNSFDHTFASAYSATKYQGERVILEESKGAIETVIIRPRGIIGAGDNSIMPRVLRIAKKGWFPLINGGKAIIDVTYAGNVAHALLLAATVRDVDGECFNISNEEPVTVKHLLSTTFCRLHLTSRMIYMPYWLAQGTAWALETISRLFSTGEPVLTRYSVGLISKSQVLNIDKAKRILGYRPIYSLHDAIDSYIDAYQQASRDE